MKKFVVLSAVSLLLAAAPVARSAPLPPQQRVAGPLDPILDAAGSAADALVCQGGFRGHPDGDPYDGDIYDPYGNRTWDCPPYND
jgi:hypothetical protein